METGDVSQLPPWESPVGENDKRLDLEWINKSNAGYSFSTGRDYLNHVIPSRVLSDLPDDLRDAIAQQELHGVLDALERLDRRRASLRLTFFQRHQGYVRKNAPHMLGLCRPADVVSLQTLVRDSAGDG